MWLDNLYFENSDGWQNRPVSYKFNFILANETKKLKLGWQKNTVL